MNDSQMVAPTAADSTSTRRRRGRVLTAVFSTIVAIVASLAFTAQPAAASATGCAWWGPVSVGGFTLQTGELCASVNGSGTWVNSTSVSFNSPWSNVCNWREVAFFKNIYSQTYLTVYGPTHLGCWHVNWDAIGIYRWVQAGKVTIQLQVNGARVTEVTHSIYP